jgi:hypothetical protein
MSGPDVQTKTHVALPTGKMGQNGAIAGNEGCLSLNLNQVGKNEKTPDFVRGFHRLSTSDQSGDDRDRTDDLLNAIQALSQLSYTPLVVKV